LERTTAITSAWETTSSSVTSTFAPLLAAQKIASPLPPRPLAAANSIASSSVAVRSQAAMFGPRLETRMSAPVAGSAPATSVEGTAA
jgi:hypothetical protein